MRRRGSEKGCMCVCVCVWEEGRRNQRNIEVIQYNTWTPSLYSDIVQVIARRNFVLISK